jgi:hypothetical protein
MTADRPAQFDTAVKKAERREAALLPSMQHSLRQYVFEKGADRDEQDSLIAAIVDTAETSPAIARQMARHVAYAAAEACVRKKEVGAYSTLEDRAAQTWRALLLGDTKTPWHIRVEEAKYETLTLASVQLYTQAQQALECLSQAGLAERYPARGRSNTDMSPE